MFWKWVIHEEVWPGESVKVTEDWVWWSFQQDSQKMVHFVLELNRLQEEKECQYPRYDLFSLSFFSGL